MQTKPYLTNRWAIFQDRASTKVLGYIIDGVGRSIHPDQQPFQIDDDELVAPDGSRLGRLTNLGDSWATDLGNYSVGHVLREIPL